jgi:hypothetical protein
VPVIWWLFVIVILVSLGIICGFSLKRLGTLPRRERS